MKLPCEIIAQYILPKLRSSIAKILSEEGYNQKEIASYLGVSQPVVSGYIKHETELPTGMLPLQSVIDELIDSYRDEHSLNEPLKSNSVDFLPEICYICKNARISGPICVVHHQQQHGLPENCTICITSEKIHSVKEKKIALRRQLLHAAKEIFSLQDISKFVPQIGSQFAVLYAEKKHVTENDVISFPGRIIRYKNRAKIIDTPNFGESDFSSKLLLYLYKIGQEKRCLLILKNNKLLMDKIAQIQEEQNLEILHTRAFDENWNDVLDNFKTQKIDIITDEGAPGYESLVYVFTNTIEEMIELAHLL